MAAAVAEPAPVKARSAAAPAGNPWFGRSSATNASPSLPIATQEYDQLCKKLKETSALSGISGLLGWDEMVMMPPGAASARAAQKAALAGVLHERQTDPDLGRLLGLLTKEEALAQLDDFQRAVVREAARDHRRACALSKALAQREAELESRGYQAWVKAREASDFALFAPLLREWVALKRERAAAIDPAAPPYDVLLDDFEKGFSAARVDSIFNQLKAGLVPLLAEIRARGSPPDATWLRGEYDAQKQAELCHRLALDLGFSLEHGRLDTSVHPFTGGAHPTDVRMTTRFKREDLTEGITAAIHETGHALYEQGRNLEYDGLPVNAALSMGVHESQSLLWERMVGLGRPFAAHLLPLIRETFPQVPGDKTPEDLYRAMSIVHPVSMIRVESDEVTYALHIVLRYEIERALVEGSLDVADVPAVWNQKMQEYLGCTPESDARGCLQDVHWSAGLFGYFPTYTLGAMYAAQLYQAAEAQLPGLADDLAAGRFSRLKLWLGERIHRLGSLHASGDELMQHATGRPLDPSVFLAYLNSKYRELYRLG